MVNKNLINGLQDSGMTEQRFDWSSEEIQALFDLPFNDLLFRAHTVHRQNFDANDVQVSTLLSIKTGSCPEDCKYCPQSAHYNTGLSKERLLEINKVLEQAKEAKKAGASRFCMGAAWRSPTERDMPAVLNMVREVKALGLETCMTLGMLKEEQAEALAGAGLDYYNHNLDTSAEFYGEIITTRTYADRLATLEQVRKAGMKVCTGGILGMGEQVSDRIGLLQQLASLQPHPESVPLNMLVKVPGTPMENLEELEPLEFIRVIAVARILMPTSRVRLSAGREKLDTTAQAMAFFAGANSIFYGDKLLTTGNPEAQQDQALFRKLGINMQARLSPVSEQVHEAALLESLAEKNKLFLDAAAPKLLKQSSVKPCGLVV